MEPVDDYLSESETLLEYNEITERIEELRSQRKYYAAKLKETDNEDDIIEFKFQMMKIKEELSPLVSKQKILAYDINVNKQKKERALKEENERAAFEKKCKTEADKIYKRLYVTLNDKQLNLLKKIFEINQSSRELIFKEMFDNNSFAEIIIITSLFDILPFSEMERKVKNDEKYSLIYDYENNEIIFNKLRNLPDIKFVEWATGLKVTLFEEAYPYFSYNDEEEQEYVSDMFIKYNYFFK